MVDGKVRNRRTHLLMLFCVLLGSILLVIVFLGSHLVVSETWVLGPFPHLGPSPHVRSLLCSFEKYPFETKEILDVTGHIVRQINVTLRNETLLLYMNDFLDCNVEDVGTMIWKEPLGSLRILTFSPLPLSNGSRYVVQRGHVIEVTRYGGKSLSCLLVEEIRTVNWLDEAIVNNPLLTKITVIVILTGALSLIVVPLLDPFLGYFKGVWEGLWQILS